MKINEARQILGFHIMADIELWWNWYRFHCLAGNCEERFSSRRRLKNHLDFECKYSGKQFYFYFGGNK